MGLLSQATQIAMKEIGGNFSSQSSKTSPIKPPDYTPDPKNWYQAQPYSFKFYDRSTDNNTGTPIELYLPISPSNLTITTHYATNIVTTLYGVIEEHSEVRYYDIVISGTTGYAPKYNNYVNTDSNWDKGVRDSFTPDISIDFGGWFPEIQNKITGVVDSINNIANTVEGETPNSSGVKASMTGYMAFHRLYKLFLKYKEDVAGLTDNKSKKRKIHPLWFVNYKDNNQYACIPVTFTMTRSAESPMLYFYNIRLRGFNMKDVNAKVENPLNLEQFGLGGIEQNSVFGKMTSVISNATSIVATIGSAF